MTSPLRDGIARSSSASATLRGEKLANGQPRAIYDGLQRALFHSELPAKAIAERAGLRYSTVTELANESRGKRIALATAIDLTLASGSFEVLDAAEALVGRRAFLLPSVQPQRGEIFEQSGRLFLAMAEAVDKLPGMLADGRIDPDERALFREMAASGAAMLWRLVAMVDEKAEESEAA